MLVVPAYPWPHPRGCKLSPNDRRLKNPRLLSLMLFPFLPTAKRNKRVWNVPEIIDQQCQTYRKESYPAQIKLHSIQFFLWFGNGLDFVAAWMHLRLVWSWRSQRNYDDWTTWETLSHRRFRKLECILWLSWSSVASENGSVLRQHREAPPYNFWFRS